MADDLEQKNRWIAAIDQLELSEEWDLWWGIANSLVLTPQRGWCNTAATDGVHLFFNPEWTETLTDAKVLFTLIHEVYHVASEHLWRVNHFLPEDKSDLLKMKKVRKDFNKAADYMIHCDMVPKAAANTDTFPIEFPPEGLYDAQFNGMSTEEIYNWLLENPDSPQAKSGSLDMKHLIIVEGGEGEDDTVVVVNGEGEIEEAISSGDLSKPLKEKLEKIKKGLEEAESEEDAESEGESDGNPNGEGDDKDSKSKKGGRGKSSSTRILDTSGKNGEDWASILEVFCVQSARNDYSWRKSNRRSFVSGIMMPGLQSSTLIGVICIDVSGSINKNTLRIFASNVEFIRAALPDHELHILCVSERVTNYQFVLSQEDMEIQIKGSGGTAFKPAFDWVDENCPNPNFLIYFTDGHNYEFEPVVDPGYPVLWALNSNGKVKEQPFGENLILAV